MGVAVALWTTELVKSFLYSNFCGQIFLWSSLIIMNHRHFMIFEVFSPVLQETFLWQEFSWSLCSSYKLQSIQPQTFGAIQYSYITNSKWTSITATVLYDYLTVCAPICLISIVNWIRSVYCWLPNGAGWNNLLLLWGFEYLISCNTGWH